MKKEFIPAPGGLALGNSMTRAVRAGDLVFLGGHMSLDDQGRVVGSDITTQARNAFEAMKQTLKYAGATLDDVVKHNVYFHCDGNQTAVEKFLEDLDRVRCDYFSYPGPTTTELRVGLERKGALILIDAWAFTGEGTARTILGPSDHWRWGKNLPFVQGWKVGDMVFIGGQRSLDSEGRLLGEGDIEVQTDNVFATWTPC